MWVDFVQAVQQVVPVEQHGDIVEKTVTQLPIAFMVVKVIEWLKKAQWFPLSETSSARILMLANAFSAFVIAVGINFTFETVDTGHWRFAIDGPVDLGSKLWAFVTQWSMQQFFYERHQERKVALVTHNVVTGADVPPLPPMAA